MRLAFSVIGINFLWVGLPENYTGLGTELGWGGVGGGNAYR